MEVVLVGLPGSGKSAVGTRLAARRGAEFVDLDRLIERAAGRNVPEIFAAEGEIGFRAWEAAAIEALGPAHQGASLRRVVATGGGAVVEPRNRWRLYRGRRVAWLDASPERLARRLADTRSRPLLAGRDPVEALRQLHERRARFYAAGSRVDAEAPPSQVLERLERTLAAPPPAGTRLLRADTPVGRLDLGQAHAEAAVREALGRLEAYRVAIVSEPTAWRLHGAALASQLAVDGFAPERLLAPRGEAAKTVAALERLLRQLARQRFERSDPLVALGGGALGDAAGFAAAIYLRGVPLVHVPTTLLAQIDSAIGGKTAIDLPEGKNLVGAFYQPQAIVLDISLLTTLPSRQRRAALGEAVKYAALGDERLLDLLEREGGGIARGDEAAVESGALAELVERCAWRKVEIVSGDEREQGERILLNLGHSLGHAIEAAAGYRGLLHGEAVAHGLRGALAIGRLLGVTPPERAERIERLLGELRLGATPPGVAAAAVRAHLGADKKHSRGRLRWVLPDGSGAVVHSDVPDSALEAGLAAALRGSRARRADGRRPRDARPPAPDRGMRR